MPREKKIFRVPENLSGARMDACVAALCEELTRSLAQQLIAEGAVLLCGKPAVKSTRAKAGDEITIILPELREVELEAQNIPLEIVYEDKDLLVVNKPKGMVVHPAPGNPDGTLVNALMYHCKGSLSGINGELRPGIVHRIDKDTSGLLVVAKNDTAHVHLSEQLSRHAMTRVYQAVVYGRLKEPEGIIEASIGRSQKDRKKMAVTDKNAKNAVTTYKTIAQYNSFTHIELRLKTGRTHQIRVHMAHIGHPVAGDLVYGPKSVITELGGQCLHAGTLGFIHPATSEYMEFTAPLPEYFTRFIAKLK